MHVTATDLKNRLGQYLEASVKEPVIIEKSGRPSSVVISFDEYQRFLALEDQLWAIKALESGEEGFLGTEKSVEFMKELEKRIAYEAQKTRSRQKRE